MDDETKELVRILTADKPAMVELLKQFCEMNSGSENLLGLAGIRQALRIAFAPLADKIEEIDFPPINTIDISGESRLQQCGQALFISKRQKLKPRILLVAHMDTVYGSNHPFQSVSLINDQQIKGPGVTDMKGGLVVIQQALVHFEQRALAAKLGWDLFINADEELGSPASAAFLAKIAPNYQAALVYEPALTASGTLAKNRRGSGKMTLIARGKSAHVGRSFQEGRNAICYLAEIVTQIHALNQLDNGITLNVGKIAGGDALNVVPYQAVAQLDIRISKPEDEQWVRSQLDSLISYRQEEGYSLTCLGGFNRPVKRICSATEGLFARVQKAGRALGLTLDWQDSGGCCDGNNLAHYGLPVIDTLGVRGGNIHSPNEFILVDSLVERAALTTLLLLDLAEGGLEALRP